MELIELARSFWQTEDGKKAIAKALRRKWQNK